MNKWKWLLLVLCMASLVCWISFLVVKGGMKDEPEQKVTVVREPEKEKVPADDYVHSEEIEAVPESDLQVEPPVIEAETKPVREEIPKVRIETVSYMPPSLSVVMGEGLRKDYSARLNAVRSLNRELTPDEIQTLYILMNRKTGEDSLPDEELYALKDSVCSLLEKQKGAEDSLAHNLMAMYYDSGHDYVWRDYCVQHLGTYLEKVRDEYEQSEIADLFLHAAGQKQEAISGTALLSMVRNLESPFIKREEVSGKALELAEDPASSESAKITAYQICATLGEKRILNTVRNVASSGSSVPLRMSAIAAVGTLGDESDRGLLSSYAQSSDVRLRKSAEGALRRLGL